MRIFKNAMGFMLFSLMPYANSIGLPYVSEGLKALNGRVIPDEYRSLSNSNIFIGRAASLGKITKEFGEGKFYPLIYGRHPKYICYKSDSDDTAVAFVLGSTSHSHDYESETIVAIWIGHSRYIDIDKCSMSNRVNRKAIHINGISLDSEFTKIQKVLGKPIFYKKPFAAYRYRSKRYINYRVYNIFSGMEMEFKKGRLEWFCTYIRSE